MSTSAQAPSPFADRSNILRRSPRLQKSVSVSMRPFRTPIFNSSSHSPVSKELRNNSFNSNDANPNSPTGNAKDRQTNDLTDDSLPASSSDQQLSSSGAVLIGKKTDVDVLVKAFTFFSAMTKNQLRKTCKNWSKRLAGNKLELLYRSFLYVKSLEDSGKNVVASIDENNGCPCFSDFLRREEKEFVDWKEPPSDTAMIKLLTEAGDKFEEPRGANVRASNDEDSTSEAPNFSHSEFARLVLLLRDDEKARSAIYAMSQSLTRSALDSGVTRESYWKVIAERFNDSSVEVNFDFDGNIDYLDVSKAPLCHRSPTFLKEQVQKARPDFTKALQRWRTSGQNDPEKFPDFLSYNRGKMYASSVRAYILFICCRLGTPFEVELLVDVATKVILGGGCEEGIESNRRPGCDGRGEDDATDRKRRRKSSTDFAGEVGVISKSVENLGSVVNSLLNGTYGASQVLTSKPRTPTVDIMQEEEDLYEKLEMTYEALERAKTRGNATMLRFATARHQDAIACYERLMTKKASMSDRNAS